ncbi:hypothetical protein DBY21_03685 [Candidatus Gastranaerophilales bacterium]|nr:MAG: hypothetical protein DBY21_03685 [Candidatus Gastranaerophilales bacterium]
MITLGVIGIIAAMTLPSLIQRNNNKVVETRLKKFYTSINQAILMAEKDYGDKKYWYQDVTNTTQKDEDGNFIKGSNKAELWFNQYLAPYLNILRSETLNDGTFVVYFPDGSALQPVDHTTRDWNFYPGSLEKCRKKYKPITNAYGICVFPFIFYPTGTNEDWQYHYNKGMEPYKYRMHKINDLYSNKFYSTAVIQMNNWSVPKQYRFKISY